MIHDEVDHLAGVAPVRNIGSVSASLPPRLPRPTGADFIRDSRLEQPVSSVIFTGEVLSVRDYRDAKGNNVRDTTIHANQSWMGGVTGNVLVRSITPPTLLPCSPPPALEAKAGEQWLVFGWAHDGWIAPYIDARVTVP